MCGGRGYIGNLCTFCCEPKISLKNKVKVQKKKNGLWKAVTSASSGGPNVIVNLHWWQLDNSWT